MDRKQKQNTPWGNWSINGLRAPNTYQSLYQFEIEELQNLIRLELERKRMLEQQAQAAAEEQARKELQKRKEQEDARRIAEAVTKTSQEDKSTEQLINTKPQQQTPQPQQSGTGGDLWGDIFKYQNNIVNWFNENNRKINERKEQESVKDTLQQSAQLSNISLFDHLHHMQDSLEKYNELIQQNSNGDEENKQIQDATNNQLTYITNVTKNLPVVGLAIRGIDFKTGSYLTNLSDAIAAWIRDKNAAEIDSSVGEAILNLEKYNNQQLKLEGYSYIEEWLQTIKDVDTLTRSGKNDEATLQAILTLRNRKNELRKRIDDLYQYLSLVEKQDAPGRAIDGKMPVAGVDYNTTYNASTGAYEGDPFDIGNNHWFKDVWNDVLELDRYEDIPTMFRPVHSINLALAKVKNIRNKHNGFLTERKKWVDRRAKKLSQDRDDDLADIEAWLGNYQISDDFARRELSAQQNGMKFSDPDTWTAGIWGTLGSSASNNGVLLASQALGIAGNILVHAGDGRAKLAGTGALLLSAGLGMESGRLENQAEVAQNYIERATTAIIKSIDQDGIKSFLDDMQKHAGGRKIKDVQDAFRELILMPQDERTAYLNKQQPEFVNAINSSLNGASNLFLSDMVATTWDVGVLTAINAFLPFKMAAGGSTATTVGTKASKLLRFAKAHPTLYKATANAIRAGLAVKNTSVSFVGGISPVAAAIWSPIKTVGKAFASKVMPAGSKYALSAFNKYMRGVSGWMAEHPNVYMKAKPVLKNIGTNSKRLLTTGWSEAIEEGKQYLHGQQFQQGEYDDKTNSLIDALADDMQSGSRAAYAFIGDQFFGLQADTELMTNMRGGFIGGIANIHSAMRVYDAVLSTYKDEKSANVIMNNIMAMKASDSHDLISGEYFAKMSSPKAYAHMMTAFDNMIKLQERTTQYGEAIGSPFVTDDEGNMYDEDGNITTDKNKAVREIHGLSRSAIETQRSQYKRVFNMYNNPLIEKAAERHGISKQKDKDRYIQYVSLLNHLTNRLDEVRQREKENDELFRTAYNGVLESIYQNETFLSKNVIELILRHGGAGITSDLIQLLLSKGLELLYTSDLSNKKDTESEEEFYARMREEAAKESKLPRVDRKEDETDDLYELRVKQHAINVATNPATVQLLLGKMKALSDLIGEINDINEADRTDSLKAMLAWYLRLYDSEKKVWKKVDWLYDVLLLDANGRIDLGDFVTNQTDHDMLTTIMRDRYLYEAERQPLMELIMEMGNFAGLTAGEGSNVGTIIGLTLDEIQKQLQEDKKVGKLLLKMAGVPGLGSDAVNDLIDRWNNTRKTDQDFLSKMIAYDLELRLNEQLELDSAEDVEDNLDEPSEDVVDDTEEPVTDEEPVTGNGTLPDPTQNGIDVSPYLDIRKPIPTPLKKGPGFVHGIKGYTPPVISSEPLYDLFLLSLPKIRQKAASNLLSKIENGKPRWQYLLDCALAGATFEMIPGETARLNKYRMHQQDLTTKIRKAEYDFYMAAKPLVDQILNAAITVDTEPNTSLLKTLELLNLRNQWIAAHWAQEYTTPYDYFIKNDAGVLLRVSRVHSVIKKGYDLTSTQKGDINTETRRLLDLQRNDIEAFKKEIIKIEKEYNDWVDYVFEDEIYRHVPDKKHPAGKYVSLAGYCEDAVVKDAEICAHLAQMKYDRIIYPSVILGTAVDEIMRDVFAGKDAINKDWYKLRDDLFADLVSRAKEYRQKIIDAGFVISTDAYMFNGNINGQRVAGVTDMILIDPDGLLVISDFKTSNISRLAPRFERPVITDEDELEVFRTVKPDKLYGEEFQFASYADNYAEQLSAYYELVSQCILAPIRATLLVIISTMPESNNTGKVDYVTGKKIYKYTGARKVRFLGGLQIKRRLDIGNNDPVIPNTPPNPPSPPAENRPTGPVSPSVPGVLPQAGIRFVVNNNINGANVDHILPTDWSVDEKNKFEDDTCARDFIDNSKWEFVNDNGYLKLNITYNGHTYKGLVVEFLEQQRPLAQLITGMLLLPGVSSVVVTQKHRTNGKILLGDNSLCVDAGIISNEDLLHLIERKLVGVTKLENGQTFVQQITLNLTKYSIFKYTGTAPGGLVNIIYDLKYTENPPETNRVPISLYADNIKEGDAELIVDIISKSETLNNYAKKDGVELPFTNKLILKLLTRFVERSDDDKSAFVFKYADDGEGGIDYTHVVLTDKNNPSNVIKYSLIDDQEKQSLVLALQGFQLHMDTSILASNLNAYTDTRPDNIFARLADWFSKNKDADVLRISDSISFYRDEVFSDKNDYRVGLSGVAWRIKKGTLFTRFGKISNATLYVDGVSAQIDSQEQAPQQEASLVTDPNQLPQTVDDALLYQDEYNNMLDDYNADDNYSLGAMDDDIGIGLESRRASKSGKTLDTDLAKKRINRILGSTFGENYTLFGEEAEDVLSQYDTGVVGICKADAIAISSNAEQGVEFHEAFHRVFELLMSDRTRESIYKRYRRKHNDKTYTDREITEVLADIYMDFRNALYDAKEIIWYEQPFKKIQAWAKAWSSVSKEGLLWASIKIAAGVYRFKKPTSERIKRFKEKFGTLTYDIFVNGKTIDLKLFLTQSDVDAMISGLFYDITNEAKLDVFAYNSVQAMQDPSSKAIDFSLNAIKSMRRTEEERKGNQDEPSMYAKKRYLGYSERLGRYLTDVELEQTPAGRMILKYKEIFDHWDEVQPLFEEKLMAIGFGSIREQEEENDENKLSEEAESMGTTIELHTAPAYTKPKSNSLSFGLKLLFSTIKNERYATEEDIKDGIIKAPLYYTDKSGKPVRRKTIPVSTNSLGLPEYLDYKEVYNRLMIKFHNVQTVKELHDKLNQAAPESPLFRRIANVFHRAYVLSVARHKDGKPIAIVDGKRLNPNSYMVTKDNEVINIKTGSKINDAQLIINHTFESITTQIFLAIKSQLIDFMFCIASHPVVNGKQDINVFNYRIRSTNSDVSERMYPMHWFDAMRNGTTGIVQMRGDKIHIKNPDVFNNVAQIFATIRQTMLNIDFDGIINLNGESINMYTPDGFDQIVHILCKLLSQIGIITHPDAFNFMLDATYPALDRYNALRTFFVTSETFSVNSFVNMLLYIGDSVKAGNYNIITNDSDKDGSRSGFYLYSRNGIVKHLAEYFAKYVNATLDLMTIGPELTQLYTMSLNHTASDITADLDRAYVDENGNLVGSLIATDMSSFEYNMLVEESLNGDVKIRKQIGSILLKYLHNKQRVNIKLQTFVGLKMEHDVDGGVKYTDITETEDFLAKCLILQQNGIVFPTLADKSTWFYIIADDPSFGLKLPGINYRNLLDTPLLHLLKGTNTFIYQRGDNAQRVAQNAALDQFIEYAKCERAAIVKTINELQLNERAIGNNPDHVLNEDEKIDNYHKGKNGPQGARFSGLTGIYLEDGTYILFNNKKKTPIQNLNDADLYFFSKDADEQRAILLRTFTHHLDEMIDECVKHGIITRIDGGRKYLNLRNKMLDNSTILNLTNELMKRYPAPAGVSDAAYRPSIESLAICNYLMDINMKSCMSIEEVERLYTGHPAFFNWIYDDNGVLIDRQGDEVKRFGGTGSTGENNREDLPNIATDYVCAEIEDYKVGSILTDNMRESFINSEYRETYYLWLLLSNKMAQSDAWNKAYSKDTSIDQIKEELPLQLLSVCELKVEDALDAIKSGINVADGSAYITDKMAENLLRMRGMYLEPVAEAFEFLRGNIYDEYEVKVKDNKIIKKQNKKPLTSRRAYKIIHNALLSTQKYSAFGYRMLNGLPVHFYDKFALFPLFDNVATGFMQNVYAKMKEDGVDMLMFKSAVKVGSQGAQPLHQELFRYNDDPSNEDNFVDGDLGNLNWKPSFSDFHFNKYKQQYKFIRRQLNTDPRTSEYMPVGTLPVKVGLTNLDLGRPDYMNPYGKQVNGRQVRLAIMDAILTIADILKELFLDKLLTNGEYDLEKVSIFLRDLLATRDADRNLLDGLRIVERLRHDDEGNEVATKEFNIPLLCQSSINWLLSILVSEINKAVIDINLPGNAYYQRSVFGMEGNPLEVVSDEHITNTTINGGKPLQMVNEEGSMDAVISYDYFMHLVPENIRYDFEKGRLWLIDNKIIGPNAKANTLSYRIPTLALSSIHALRFVDVLPVMRDTIILPKEFTAITGSDFK